MKRYPAALIWQLKPFAHHIDGGFGAIGDAFHDAAEQLDESVKERDFYNSSLPAAYLHRHATELYLKACIIVLHRALGLPFSPKKPQVPAVKADGDWLPIRSVHSVAKLHAYLMTLFEENRAALSEITETDWTTLPQELSQWISQIGEFDEASIFSVTPVLTMTQNPTSESPQSRRSGPHLDLIPKRSKDIWNSITTTI